MGNCRSCESRSTVTAKLILFDGKLQEFSWPVKVSLLQDSGGFFICNSEEMEFGEFATEMGGDEVLQPGELYFELPSGWRNRRLQAEDMAALASKAGVALAKRGGDDGGQIIAGCCSCGSRKVGTAVLFSDEERPLLAEESGGGRGRAGAGAKGHKFVAKLSAIVEDL